MKKMAVVIFFFFSFPSFSQSWHLGLFGGIANYEGDLVSRAYQQSKPAFGITAGYEISDRFSLRSGLTLAKIAGADQYGGNEFLKTIRNLSFESNITEFSLVGELTVFNLYNIRWSPYLFGGLAVFHFNPYTYDDSSQKVFLKPLSTEGEGLKEYPDRKPYALTQLAIPLGGGIKYAVNDNIRIALEFGLRKTFTDYLDDVSTTYVDPNILLSEKGQQAVDLSYRGSKVPGTYSGGGYSYPDTNGYPTKGAQRGSPKYNDYYYFTGLHITFRLGGGNGGKATGSGHHRGYGCPANPM